MEEHRGSNVTTCYGVLERGRPCASATAPNELRVGLCHPRKGAHDFDTGAALGNHVSEAATSAGKNSCEAAAQLRRLPGTPGGLWQSFAGPGSDLNALPTAVPTVTFAAHL